MTKDDSLNGLMKKAMALFSPTMTAKIACFTYQGLCSARSSSYFRLCVGIQRACGCARALSCTASQLFKSITNPKESYLKSLTEKDRTGSTLESNANCVGGIHRVLALLVLLGRLSGLVLLLISVMNAASYWFYAQDKEAAQNGQRRVPENTLHLLSFLGDGLQHG